MQAFDIEDARRATQNPTECGSLYARHTQADKALLSRHNHFLWRLRVLLGAGPLDVATLAERYGIKVSTLQRKLRVARAFGYVTVSEGVVHYREPCARKGV